MARLNTLGAAVILVSIGVGSAIHAQDFDQDWAGFYIGAHLDGTAYSVEIADANASFLNDHPEQTYLLPQGGVTGGYNYILENNLLVGGELEWSSELAIDEFFSSNVADTTGLQYDLRMTGVTQIRGRAGFVQGNALGYLTLGIAQAQTDMETYQVDTSSSETSCGESNCASTTEPLLGVSFGAGIDWAFRENWIARVEFQQMVFESVQAPVLNSDGDLVCSVESEQCSISYEPKTTSIRFGITYMFE